MSMAVAKWRVKLGGAILDRCFPGAILRMNPDKIAVRDMRYCPLGQASGHYYIGRNVIGKTLHALFGREEEVRHGFLLDEHASFDELDEAWKELVCEHQRAAA